MSKLSRRDFLKSTAAGAVGLAAAGLLGACSNEASTSNSECVCEPTTAAETIAYPTCEPAENYEPKAAGS